MHSLGAFLLQGGQVRQLLADGDCVVERRASPGTGHGVGQQGGEEDGRGVAELTRQLHGQQSRRQGVRRRPREGRCTCTARKKSFYILDVDHGESSHTGQRVASRIYGGAPAARGTHTRGSFSK